MPAQDVRPHDEHRPRWEGPIGYRLCRHQAKHGPRHRVHSPRLSSGFTEASEHARTDAAIKLPDPRMRYRLGPATNRRFLP